jgi:RNA polymerase subunit RPABC4/transcription elongation factor Spt4
MGLFDIFDGKKSKFQETGDDLLDNVVKKASDLFEKPVMDKAMKQINGAADLMTKSLEAIKNDTELPEDTIPEDTPHDQLPDFDSLSKNWDSLIDQIEDKELNKYKICPSCNDAVPSENKFCPLCGAKLPEQTAARRTCPFCGTENRALALTCVKCGKEIPLITPSEETKED